MAIGIGVVAIWVLIVQREGFHELKEKKIGQINRLFSTSNNNLLKYFYIYNVR